MFVKRTRKIRYNSPEVTIMETRIQDIILSTSVTDHPMTIASVQVDEYEKDSSFGTDGVFELGF